MAQQPSYVLANGLPPVRISRLFKAALDVLIGGLTACGAHYFVNRILGNPASAVIPSIFSIGHPASTATFRF